MSEQEPIYERRLIGLLFDAANKTEEFVRQKIAIIEAGNARHSAAMLPQARRGAKTGGICLHKI